MRWLLGIDHLDHTLGAPQLAAWLAARTTPPAEIIGVHVVEDAFATSEVGARANARLDAARATLRQAAAKQGAALATTEAVLARNAAEGLATAAKTWGGDGLLVDRRAPRNGHGLVRLGRVARSLLRTLPVPVLVVPHDLAAADIGPGPIVVATDLGVSAVNAVRFATELAAATGRELSIVYVAPAGETFPSFYGETTVPPYERRGHAEVEQWLEAHEIPRAEIRVLEGGVVESVIAFAKRVDAPLIACGSEHLSPLVRLFSASVAGDLARLADRAVLAVPCG